MDADRFDRLTRALTSRLTRRGGLGLLGALGLGARVDLERVGAKKKKKKKKKRQGPCTVNRGESETTTNLTVTLKDLTLTNSDRIPRDANGVVTSTTIVRQKRALLLQTTASFDPHGLTRIEIDYGNAYTGIKRADLTTDGQTVSGTVDGRAIVPFAASAQLETFQFQDGQPTPQMSLSGKLTQQLAQLYERAGAQAEACAAVQSARASGVAADRHTSLECLTCVGSCAAGATVCAIKSKGPCAAAAAACLIGAPACFAGCLALAFTLCGLAAVACTDICARGPCCAVPCHHNNGDTFCCEEGQTCLRGGVCCRPGQTPCQGQNCCPSPDRCMPNGACCLHPDFPCGANCCAGGFGGITCCNGGCCTGECINNACCPSATHRRCGNGCCERTKECCNNVCCASANEDCHPTTGQCAIVCQPGQEFCAPRNECCPVGTTCCIKGGTWFCDVRACAPN